MSSPFPFRLFSRASSRPAAQFGAKISDVAIPGVCSGFLPGFRFHSDYAKGALISDKVSL